jgi:cytochrome bd ubiquinol oxidase subunit II
MSEFLPILTGVFLAVALSAYVLFGGADFGGGILEATLPEGLRKKLEATLAPVWEANHVWLIAVIVILFVGFPAFYALAMTRLYVPISLALVTVLVRGTFFTLRKYDPAPERWETLYSALFRASSALAPVFFGFVIGGLLTEHPGSPTELPKTLGFFTLYVEPWFHGFGALIGAFLVFLFGYLAAVFFCGELTEPLECALVRRRAFSFFAATFVSGGLVLIVGAATGRVPIRAALHPATLVCQCVAGLGIFVVTRALLRGEVWRARLAAGAQTFAILGGFFATQYPTLLRTEGGVVTLRGASAPPVTQGWLVIGLIVVLSLVIPLLVLLFRVFRRAPDGGA